MCHYAHKKFTVNVERAEEDGFISTAFGDIPVRTTDIICKDEVGNQFVVSEDHFRENYIPVKKMRKTKTARKSPFEIAYAEQLANFSLENNVESDEYINGMKALVQNKVF